MAPTESRVAKPEWQWGSATVPPKGVQRDDDDVNDNNGNTWQQLSDSNWRRLRQTAGDKLGTWTCLGRTCDHRSTTTNQYRQCHTTHTTHWHIQYTVIDRHTSNVQMKCAIGYKQRWSLYRITVTREEAITTNCLSVCLSCCLCQHYQKNISWHQTWYITGALHWLLLYYLRTFNVNDQFHWITKYGVEINLLIFLTKLHHNRYDICAGKSICKHYI